MSATLGGLIKDYRLQKNLSQLEIAFAMGWKEPSRLSRIEQGRVDNPSRELLDKLMNAMEFKAGEKGHLLLTGNYLPNDTEIKSIQEEASTLIDGWSYPAELLDFSWRVLYENEIGSKLYNSDKIFKSNKKNYPNVLELVFSLETYLNNLYTSEELENWHNWLEELLIHFRKAQRNRTKEDWYIKLIKKQMNNDLFRKLWGKTIGMNLKNFTTDHGLKTFIHPQDITKRLRFYFFIVPVVKDPRFDIELHVPADLETFQYFSQNK